MIIFTDENFAEMCRKARTEAKSLEHADLLWSLLVLVRIALDSDDPYDIVYSGRDEAPADLYIREIRNLVEKQSPPFLVAKIIRKELLQIGEG